MTLLRLTSLFILSLLLGACDGTGAEMRQNIQHKLDSLQTLHNEFEKYPEYDTAKSLLNALLELRQYIDEAIAFNPEHKTEHNRNFLVINRAEELHTRIYNKLSEHISTVQIPIVNYQDALMKVGTSIWAFKLQKGDILRIAYNGQRAVDVNIYNVDSEQLVKKTTNLINIKDSVVIENAAIYLVELINKSAPQYIDWNIHYNRSSLDILTTPHNVNQSVVAATKDDFMAFPKNEYQVVSLFEEPKKFTLRGGWKAFWGGHRRTILPIKIPANAENIIYSLRIDTSDLTYSEGDDLYENVSSKCSHTEIMGVTIREKQSSHSSLLREVVRDIATPHRQEEAYCSMYVFYNEKDAKTFVAKNSGEVVNYNIEYSMIGTQSCNGIIPTNKHKMLYLGFDNDQFKGSIYISVEVVSTATITNYYKVIYN